MAGGSGRHPRGAAGCPACRQRSGIAQGLGCRQHLAAASLLLGSPKQLRGQAQSEAFLLGDAINLIREQFSVGSN